jgi:hypothetical protein
MIKIDEIIKNRVDIIAKKPKDKILELIDAESITEELTDKNNKYQLEIIVSWDDKGKGILRIAAFLTRPTDKWWKSFFNNSAYERLVDINNI